jgi:predicted small lipoprotein YifL
LHHRQQQSFGKIQEFLVGHYNPLMLKASQILVRCIALGACAASLAACGQKGPLFFPSSPAASHRATLPQTLGISSPAERATPAPAPTTLPTGPSNAAVEESSTPTGASDARRQQAD